MLRRCPAALKSAVAADALRHGGALRCTMESRLVLYAKPDCPLCTKLERQLEAVLAKSKFAPSTLSSVTFRVEDVTEDVELCERMGDQVPVLVRVTEDGDKEYLPRFSPRMTTERIERKLLEIFEASS